MVIQLIVYLKINILVYRYISKWNTLWIWTFIHNNPGVDQNTINNCCINPEWIDMIPARLIMTLCSCDGVEYANDYSRSFWCY